MRTDVLAPSTAVSTVLRVLGAALLAINAGIHTYLWVAGYRSIPIIGPLFLLCAIGAAVLVIAVLAAPRRILALAATAGALLELGTAAGLFLATQYSLFGFTESPRATLYQQSLFTELAGTVVLAVLASMALRSARGGASIRRW